MIPTKLGLVIVLAFIILVIWFMLWRRDRDALSKINIEDLLLGDDGKISKTSCIILGAFVFTTWMMGYLTLMGKMTEGYAGLYLAGWVTPFVANLLKGPKTATGGES